MFGLNTSSQSDTLRLVALGAPQPQVRELRTRRITVGTAAGNDLCLDEPTASRRHAALERRRGRWHVIDLGSTNGTYVNGRRISATSATPLERGDELRFGNGRFGFVAAGDDLSQVGAIGARARLPKRRQISRSAMVVMAVLLVAGGFGITEYLLNFDRLDQAADGLAARSAASPSAATRTAVASPNAAPPATPRTAAIGAVGAGVPQWLARLNYYRVMVKLAPLSDAPALSAGALNHARYVVENYGRLISEGVNTGAAMHTEDAAKPGYTSSGLQAAQESDIDEWPGPHPPRSSNWAVDDWMTGAFHRLNILNPSLRQVAYGQWCGENGVCVAVLNVLGGAEPLLLSAMPLVEPLMFPPPGSALGLGPLYGEWPDPVSSCPGYRTPAGLPITLQLGAMVDAKLDAYRLTRNGEAPVDIEACGFDVSSYANPDDVARQRGRDVLRSAGAVAVVPRAPLDKGASYTVSMTVNGREYKWSFSTAP